MAQSGSRTQTYIDRTRYWKIVRFFARVILSVAFVDLLLGRVWFVKLWVQNSRTNRFRGFSIQFRELCIEMGGVMIKLGQFLSARVDVLPLEVTEQLQGLQDEVPEISPPVLKRALQREFGNVNDVFAELEWAPLAAASLGQTMRAWLKREDGQPGRGEAVVIKVLRPDIEAICETDLAALRTVAPWLMRYKPIRRRADVPDLMEEFARTLWEELDYQLELQNIKRFQSIFAERDNIYIPIVYEELCTSRALVLENVENMKINDLEGIRAAGIDEKAVADALIEAYLFQLFKHGVFHADPHPGNVFIRPKPLTPEERANLRPNEPTPYQIIFIDFGMIGRLPEELRQNLGQVLIGLVQKDARRVINAYDKMNFFLPGTDLERIVEAQDYVMERLDGRNLQELAQPDPEEVMEIGNEFRDILFDLPFQVPQNFVYLGRALGILSGIASSLYPQINPWYQIQRYGLDLINVERQFDFSPESIAGWVEFFQPYLKLPGQVQRVVRAAENGRLRVQSADPIAARRLERIDRRLGFLNVSVVVAAGILSGTMLYINRKNGSNGNGANGHH